MYYRNGEIEVQGSSVTCLMTVSGTAGIDTRWF